MKYLSTRGSAPILGFEDVLLTGLARDGGLYLPESYPALDLGAYAGLPFDEAAFKVMQLFVDTEIEAADLRVICHDAYATFEHSATCPLVQIGTDSWVLELFHGPTLAFKDVAMQVLGRLMDHALAKRGASATIVGATSGDTGSAAIDAFRGRAAIDIFILHPHGRTSDIQRRQMTTATEANVHNIAIEGTFDDCQALVKAMFNDLALRDRLQLSGVNSINWARIMAQISYYVTSLAALGATDARRVSFSVPTGNFGDVLAGYVAARMGAPIDGLIVATNSNDILVQALSTGIYKPRQAVATQSPSMDIQVSSNFERLLFEIAQRRPEQLRQWMGDLQARGSFSFDPSSVIRPDAKVRFEAFAVDEAATTAAIAETYARTGYLADPHTAVGLAAAARGKRSSGQPMIALATAHPAKFPDAIVRAIGRPPAIPERLLRVLEAEERFTVLPNDFAAVTRFVSERARVGSAA